MVTTKLNLSMTEPSVRQIYAKQGDTGRVLDIALDQTPEDGTLRILRPDGVEVTSEAVTGGEVESGSSFESLTEADVTELTAEIEPVQDLNGYDKPWVGGAGKNILDVADRTISDRKQTPETIRTEGCTVTKSGDTLTCTITGAWSKLRLAIDTSTLVNGQAYTASAKFSNPSANVVGVGWYDTAWHNTTTSRDTTVTVSTSFTYSSDMSTVALGFIVNNTNASTGNTVVVSEMQLEKGSSKTSFAPYSNICPITGHDEVRVTDVGKNLYSRENGAYNVPVYGTDGSSASYPDVNAVWIPVKPNTLYTVASARTESSNFYVRWINCTADKEFISRPLGTVNSNQLPLSLRTPANCYWVEVAVNQYPTSQISRNDWELSVVEGASTAYEPYQGSTYTTSLGQTVYGGTLDMVTGVLTVDKAFISTTWGGLGAGGTLTNNERRYYVLTQTGQYPPTDATQVISNVASWLQNYGSDTPHFYVNDVYAYVYLPIGTDDATPVQIVYELATPVEYQLTPQQIKTLVGTNNVWASSGDIVSIKFTYGGLLSELPSDATSVVGKCYCDVEQNGVSSMPFTLNVKKNERAT